MGYTISHPSSGLMRRLTMFDQILQRGLRLFLNNDSLLSHISSLTTSAFLKVFRTKLLSEKYSRLLEITVRKTYKTAKIVSVMPVILTQISLFSEYPPHTLIRNK